MKRRLVLHAQIRKSDGGYLRIGCKEHITTTSLESLQLLFVSLESIPSSDYTVTYTLAPKNGKFLIAKSNSPRIMRITNIPANTYDWLCIFPKEWDGCRVNRKVTINEEVA